MKWSHSRYRGRVETLDANILFELYIHSWYRGRVETLDAVSVST